jgi:hypothetical protein
MLMRHSMVMLGVINILLLFTFSNAIIRKLGGYERLLSRTPPGKDTLALSHGAIYILKGSYSHDKLLQRLDNLIKRYFIEYSNKYSF